MSDLNQQITEALGNPNVTSYLGSISKAEGTDKGADPYRTGFGGDQFESTADHPNTRKEFTQTDGTKNVTTAAGAYQFIKPTWDEAKKTLGLKDFSPDSQDRAAVYQLIKSGSLGDVVKGDYHAAHAKDGKTWASLPSSTYAQPKRSQEFMDESTAQGSSGSQGTAGSGGDVPADRLISAYQKASAAGDTEAMQYISSTLTPRLQSAHAKAQAANDAEGVQHIEGMMGMVGGKPPTRPAPQAPKVKPTPLQAAQAAQAPKAKTAVPQAAAEPSLWDGVSSAVGKAIADPKGTAMAVGGAIKDGVVDIGHRIATDPLQALDDGVRGVANGVTFGYADKLAAKADSKIHGTKYEDEIVKQRAKTKAGGPIETIGEVASGVLAPLGVAGGITGAAMKAMPRASKALKYAAGVTAGAGEGVANLAGRTDGEMKGGDIATAAALGMLGGGVSAAATKATGRQIENTMVARYGGNKEKARQAMEIIGDLEARGATRISDAALQAKQLNAVQRRMNTPVQQGLKDLKGEANHQDLVNAATNPEGLNLADLTNLHLSGEAGDAVAHAAAKSQLFTEMTEAGQSASGLRALARGTSRLIPMPQAMHHVVNNVLSGRQTREQMVAKLLGKENVEYAKIAAQRLGASKASGSADALAALGEQAVAKKAATELAQNANKQFNRDPSNMIGLSNPHGVPHNQSQMDDFSSMLKHQMENSPETLAARAAEAAKAKAAGVAEAAKAKATGAAESVAAAQKRAELQKAGRMPVGGGYQALLEGGKSPLNLTSAEANKGLRTLANHPVLGPIANELRQTGTVADPDKFYALQNGLRRLKENGHIGAPPPALSPPTGALSGHSPVRNPISYAEKVRQAGKHLDAAVEHAPTSEMADVARSIAQESSPARKVAMFQAALKSASATEAKFLGDKVKPLTLYGKNAKK